MSKSPAEKQAYAVRREMRIRRDKTAAGLLPWFLSHHYHTDSAGYVTDPNWIESACASAVETADALLSALDSTKAEGRP